MNKLEINDIENLLNLNDKRIEEMYRIWDIGDCSLVGLVRILLNQVIFQHKDEQKEFYDTDVDKYIQNIL
jgi:hypothetical protein